MCMYLKLNIKNLLNTKSFNNVSKNIINVHNFY